MRIRTTIKARLKAMLGRVLLSALRSTEYRAGLVLLYHDVADRDGNPERELVPPISRRRFATQLAHLTRHYRIVSLPELPAAVASRGRGQAFPIALTFDDDLGHHASHALPELRAAGASATFFLCGSFLDGQPRDFWWQRLQRAFDVGTDVRRLLGEGDIHKLGRVMEALGPEQRDQVAQDLELHGGPAPAAELLTAEKARSLPYIGCHTLRHDPLPALDDTRLARTLRESRAALAEFAGYPVDTIAYPHGTYDDRVVSAARQTGFKIGLTCERQAVTPRSDPLTMGRYEPPTRVPLGEFAFDIVRTLMKAPA